MANIVASADEAEFSNSNPPAFSYFLRYVHRPSVIAVVIVIIVLPLPQLLTFPIYFPPEDTTVVAVLRSGLFFAEGIYLGFGCKFRLFDPKREAFERPKTKYTVLADAVINSGKTLKGTVGSDIFVACCVINIDAVPLFDDRLFTVRTASNSFVGGNVKKQAGTIGPDTTMRLFNLL